MLIDAQTFRRQVLDAIVAAQAQRAGGYVHLVYSPELADPLNLVDDGRRDTALIRPSNLALEFNDTAFPRLVTLDCRPVAAHLLETDAALDDPLLEASITQAYAETCQGEVADTGVINDNPDPSACAVCGWIASRQSAADLARRMAKHSHPLHPRQGYHHWLRWHNPVYLASLWPALTPAQQRALLGDALWLARDPVGQLRAYEADLTGAKPDETELNFRPSDEQWARYDAAPVVTDMARNWWASNGDKPLPPDAIERLQRHLADARRLGLRREDRRLYAAVLAPLPPGAERTPEWHALVERVVRNEAKLRDELGGLPEHFWNPRPAETGAGHNDRIRAKETVS